MTKRNVMPALLTGFLLTVFAAAPQQASASTVAQATAAIAR